MSIILDNTFTKPGKDDTPSLFQKAENASTVWGKLTDREGALEAFAVKSKAFAGFAWQGKKAKNIFGLSQQPAEVREFFKYFAAAYNASTDETEQSVKNKEGAVKAAESKSTAAKEDLKTAKDGSPTESLTTAVTNAEAEVTAAQETFAKAKAEFDASKLADNKAIAAYFNMIPVPAAAELTATTELVAKLNQASQKIDEAKESLEKANAEDKTEGLTEEEKTAVKGRISDASSALHSAKQAYGDEVVSSDGSFDPNGLDEEVENQAYLKLKAAEVEELTTKVEKQKVSKLMLVAVYSNDLRAFRRAFASFEDLKCAKDPNNFTKGLANADEAFKALKEEGFGITDKQEKDLLGFFGKVADEDQSKNKFYISDYFRAIEFTATRLLTLQNEVSTQVAETDVDKVVIPEGELETLKAAAREAAADEAKKAKETVEAKSDVNVGEPEAAANEVFDKAEKAAISERKAEIAAESTKANAVRLKRAASFTKAAMRAKYAAVKASLPELKQKVKAAQKDQTKAVLEAQKRDTWSQTFAYMGLYLKSCIFNLSVTEEVEKDEKVAAAVANLTAAKGALNDSTADMNTMKAAQGWLYGFYLTEDFSKILANKGQLANAINAQGTKEVPGMKTIDSIGKFFTFSKKEETKESEAKADVEAPAVSEDAAAPADDAKPAKGWFSRVTGFFSGLFAKAETPAPQTPPPAETKEDEPEVDADAAAKAKAAAAAASVGGSETTPPAETPAPEVDAASAKTAASGSETTSEAPDPVVDAAEEAEEADNPGSEEEEEEFAADTNGKVDNSSTPLPAADLAPVAGTTSSSAPKAGAAGSAPDPAPSVSGV